MSIIKTANVYFDSGGTYRIGKDGSNIVITGGDVIAQGVAPTAAYDQANAAFDAANSGGSRLVTVSGATHVLNLNSSNHFYSPEINENVTIQFANSATDARWGYTYKLGVIPPEFDYDIRYIKEGQRSNVSYDTLTDDIIFKPTGDRVISLVDAGASTYFSSRDLSEAWNVQTLSTETTQILGFDPNRGGFTFKSDGTEVYIVRRSAPVSVEQYSLSEAWNVQTISFTTNTDISTYSTSPYSVFLKTDGTVMYITDADTNDIKVFDLSTAWNVSSATYSANTIDIGSGASLKMWISDDGNTLLRTGVSTRRHDLTEAWNVQTATNQTTANIILDRALYIKDNTTFFMYNSDTSLSKYAFGAAIPTLTFPAGLKKSYTNYPNTLTVSDIANTFTYFYQTDDAANTYSIIYSQEIGL